MGFRKALRPRLELLESKSVCAQLILDTFGDLIGNTDRHFGNLCFFADEARQLLRSTLHALGAY